MGIASYLQAKELIYSSDSADFEGERSENLVAEAERVLGLKFPETYRKFLLDFGCGDVNGIEIYGLIDSNFQSSSVPNGIWLTLKARESLGLKSTYILIGETGDGSFLAIDTGRFVDGENLLVLLSIEGNELGVVANSFGDYLLEVVANKI